MYNLPVMSRAAVETMVLLSTAPKSLILKVFWATRNCEKTANIARGENAGRTLTYVHVVESWESLGVWNGQEALEFEHPVSGTEPVVVMVQQIKTGPILAAAQLR